MPSHIHQLKLQLRRLYNDYDHDDNSTAMMNVEHIKIVKKDIQDKYELGRAGVIENIPQKR